MYVCVRCRHLRAKMYQALSLARFKGHPYKLVRLPWTETTKMDSFNWQTLDWTNPVNLRYRKETTAAVRRKPSASALSQLPLGSTLLRMDSQPLLEATERYSLVEIFGSLSTHHENYQDLKIWLRENVGMPRGTAIRIDVQLPAGGGRELETTCRIRPDLFYTYKCREREVEAILQIEVDSKDRETTCMKLGYGLMEQLLRLRRFDDTILSCAGYYFPASKATAVIRAVLTWEDDYLLFTMSRTCLRHSEVVENMATDLDNGLRWWREITHGNPAKPFIVPLTSQFLTHRLAGAQQIPSGHSVVVLDTPHNRVLKHPLQMEDTNRLYHLQLIKATGLERSLLPENMVTIGHMHYFTYQLLLQPMSRNKAKSVFQGPKGFADGVFKAIQELHSTLKLAHLDIRLENVCFQPESHMPILIDLDRATDKEFPLRLLSLPTTSTMNLSEPTRTTTSQREQGVERFVTCVRGGSTVPNLLFLQHCRGNKVCRKTRAQCPRKAR